MGLLDEYIVEWTNNRVERARIFGVLLWRKRSLGSQSDKILRWVERILAIKEAQSQGTVWHTDGLGKCLF